MAAVDDQGAPGLAADDAVGDQAVGALEGAHGLAGERAELPVDGHADAVGGQPLRLIVNGALPQTRQFDTAPDYRAYVAANTIDGHATQTYDGARVRAIRGAPGLARTV